MGNYRLSLRAQDDLIAIARYGDEHFGVAQSDRYREQLKKRFLILAEQPQLYPAVDHIRPGYRRSVCGAHTIYYRVATNGVEIVRILKHQELGDAL
jgi:toxin ParE1/3/4